MDENNNVENQVNSNIEVETTVNNEIPVAEEATVIDNDETAPMIKEEEIILDNSQKKSTSNVILIFVVLLVVVSLMYAEEIMQFVQDNIIASNPTGVGEGNGDNLVGGYILLDDNTSSIKVHSIKFYNFKKNASKFSIGLNYESDEEYENVSAENVYIEIYNADKELLHKHLFNVGEKISRNIVRTYSFELETDVFESAHYALVKLYTEEDLNKETKLSCKYRMSNEGYNELYKHDFTFKNDMLVSYTVDKSVEVISTSTSSSKALNSIKEENNTLINAGLTSTYSDGKLVYSIDLEKLEADYIPLYPKGTSLTSVKNKEVFKKWECE